MIDKLFNLRGHTAWVTGATRGLGKQIARCLAAAGANIVTNSRNGAEAEAVAREIALEFGVETFGTAADVTDEESIAEFVSEAGKTAGSIDILVNNAGVNFRKPTTEMPLSEWKRVLDINLTGPFLCSKAVLPEMVARGWGRVIHMSSMLGTVGLAERGPYTASKGGLILLTKTQALEVAHSGVTVNALCPGPFRTEMNKALLEDPVKYQEFCSRLPVGRWGEMEEIEGPILFLASPSSSFVTGTCLLVDGGWTAQ